MLSNYNLRINFLAITEPLDPRKDFAEMSQEELVAALEKEKQDMNDVPFKVSILFSEKKTESFFEHNFAEGDTKLIDLSPLAAKIPAQIKLEYEYREEDFLEAYLDSRELEEHLHEYGAKQVYRSERLSDSGEIERLHVHLMLELVPKPVFEMPADASQLLGRTVFELQSLRVPEAQFLARKWRGKTRTAATLSVSTPAVLRWATRP